MSITLKPDLPEVAKHKTHRGGWFWDTTDSLKRHNAMPREWKVSDSYVEGRINRTILLSPQQSGYLTPG